MSSKFKNFTIRYLPETKISERIAAIAKCKHRSSAQQALHYIEEGLEKDELFDKKERLMVEQIKKEFVDKLLESWSKNK